MVDVHGIALWFYAAQVRVNQVAVLACDLGVEGVRHHRVHVLAALVHTVVHGAVEIVCGPTADTCFRVGRDVRRQQITERRLQAVPSGIR